MTDPMNKYLFTNITVLDCSGDEPFCGEVLVEGNEIVAVARNGESLQRDGAEIIDGGDHRRIRTTASTKLASKRRYTVVERRLGLQCLSLIHI